MMKTHHAFQEKEEEVWIHGHRGRLSPSDRRSKTVPRLVLNVFQDVGETVHSTFTDESQSVRGWRVVVVAPVGDGHDVPFTEPS